MIKKINVALASFGLSGQVFHGPYLKLNKGFEVVKILERTKGLSKELFPNAQIARAYEEILKDNSIELVIVNTPDKFHYKMAKEALLAGKHVVVEKPFTKTLDEAKELSSLAQSKGLLVTVYQNRRLDSDFLTVQELVKSGKLGRIVEFESHYDRYRNFIPENTWKEEEDNYTGSLFNLGSHMVDQAMVLFGKPVSVTAHLDKLRKGSRIFDYYDLRLQYEGFAALLKCSLLVKKHGPRYIIHGTDGTFLKYGLDPQEELLKKGAMPDSANWGHEDENYWGELYLEKDGVDHSEKIVSIPGNYGLFYENIFNALRGKETVLVKNNEMLLLMEILEACIKSNNLKKTIFL